VKDTNLLSIVPV